MRAEKHRAGTPGEAGLSIHLHLRQREAIWIRSAQGAVPRRHTAKEDSTRAALHWTTPRPVLRVLLKSAERIDNSAAVRLAKSTGLVILAALLATVGCKDDTNKVAAERAVISFQSIRMVDRVTGPDGKLMGARFEARWSNNGSTPATKIHSRFNFLPTAVGLPPGFNFGDRQDIPMTSSISTLAAGGGVSVGPILVPLLDLQAARGSAKGEGHLYFSGWISYNDTLTAERHLTEFCVRGFNFRPASGADFNNPKVAWLLGTSSCEVDRDCYDKDCADYSIKVTK